MYIENSKITLQGLILCLMLSTPSMADQRYYPGVDLEPIAVGSEEFKENHDSLAGLEGVRVITKYVLGAANKNELTDMKNDLDEQITQRLNDAGLRVLSEQDMKKTPGQPILSFFPSYTRQEKEAIDTPSTPLSTPPSTPTVDGADTENASCKAEDLAAKTDTDRTPPKAVFCRSSIWASFQQSASILRKPNKHYKFATWGAGEETEDCDNRGAWTYDAVLRAVDKFVADYKKAQTQNNTDTEPLLVSSVSDAPKSCAQAWLMNLSVFNTNQTEISDVVKPIFDELALTATRCERYSYIIETHADQRANHTYNRILSEARAHAIKEYLVLQNIKPSRLKTVAFGESKPLSSGTTDFDHAINRRVVIIPRLNDS